MQALTPLRAVALVFWLACALLMAFDWSASAPAEQPLDGVELPAHELPPTVRQL